MRLETLIGRIRAEFMEMPGLCVTVAQATRLWGLEPAVCEDVIEVLVDHRFLRRTPAGTVLRAEQ